MNLRPKDIRLLLDIYLESFSLQGLRASMLEIEGNYDHSVEKLAELGLVEFNREMPVITNLGTAHIGKLMKL